MNKNVNKVIITLILSILCIFGINIKSTLKSSEVEANNEDAIEAMNTNDDDEKKEESKFDYAKACWNLQSLYKSDDAWKKELKSFVKDTKELKNYVGKVTKSKTHITFALDIKEKLDIRANRLYAYVKLKKDINKNSYKYLDMTEEMGKVYKDYSRICSDLELEILKLSDDEYDKIISNNKINKKYGMYLSDIRRSKKHYLDDKSENILSNVSNISSLPSKIYELFRNMDKNTNITPAEYASIIESGARQDRKDAYQNEFIAYNDNINTLSGLLVGQVRKNIFYASERGYDSSLDMYLSSDNLNTKTYDKLIETVNKNTDSLHKYVSMRKKILKLDKLYYCYVPPNLWNQRYCIR